MRSFHRTWMRGRGWSVPLVYAVTTMVFSLTFPRLEHRFWPNLVSGMSAASATSLCSAIASGMIALTGIVFSLTFVMVQFSATAYSPRLVRWVSRDPVMAHALGVFTGTFLYALAVIAWIDRTGRVGVPLISTWLTVVMLIASVALFVALVERIGTLEVTRMLVATGDRGRQAVADAYVPPEGPAPSPADPAAALAAPAQTVRHAGRPMAIQAIDVVALVEIARRNDCVIEMAQGVGSTLIDSMPLLLVRGGRGPLDEHLLRATVSLGDERTFEQDPKYPLRIIVDIAIKALSPAINDPTTAVQALDQIEDLLLRLGRSRLEVAGFRDAQGVMRLVVPFATWDEYLLLALDEIRACGAGSIQVMRRMHALVANLQVSLPEARHPALRSWERRLSVTVSRSFDSAQEKREASTADREGLGIAKEDASPRT